MHFDFIQFHLLQIKEVPIIVLSVGSKKPKLIISTYPVTTNAIKKIKLLNQSRIEFPATKFYFKVYLFLLINIFR